MAAKKDNLSKEEQIKQAKSMMSVGLAIGIVGAMTLFGGGWWVFATSEEAALSVGLILPATISTFLGLATYLRGKAALEKLGGSAGVDELLDG